MKDSTVDAIAMVVGILVVLGIVAVCFAVGLQSAREYESMCDSHGGHVITRPTYKGSVSLCVTPDGRIVDEGD